MKKHSGMRPQDVVILLEIIATKGKYNAAWPDYTSGIRIVPKNRTNKSIANTLQISEAEVSESLRRSVYAGLLDDPKEKRINKKSLLDFMLYGVRHVFPTRPGALVRGVPTAQSAPPLDTLIVSDEHYVWSHAGGKVRGQMIEPLYSTVPTIALENKALYELLALTDAIRTGSARIVSVASAELEKRIMYG